MKRAQGFQEFRAQGGSAGLSSGQRAASRLVVALGLGVAALFAGAGSASAEGSAYVIADVQCDPAGGGVLDLTLVNERPTLDAEFVVDGPSGTSAHTVSVGSAAAVTYTGLADGVVTVGVSIDGVASPVSVEVACAAANTAPPSVEVAAVAAATAAPASDTLPRTGSSTIGLLIGAALVASGAAASLVARRRYS